MLDERVKTKHKKLKWMLLKELLNTQNFNWIYSTALHLYQFFLPFSAQEQTELRDGFKKKKLMEFSIKGPDPASQHLNEKKNNKTRSKNTLNHLKWILKSTCFFTFMRPTSPLLASPSQHFRGWVMGWVRGGHNGKKTSLL